MKKDLHILRQKVCKSTGRTGPEGTAPHKPILLLAVLDLFENGKIHRNEIYLSPRTDGELSQVLASVW